MAETVTVSAERLEQLADQVEELGELVRELMLRVDEALELERVARDPQDGS